MLEWRLKFYADWVDLTWLEVERLDSLRLCSFGEILDQLFSLWLDRDRMLVARLVFVSTVTSLEHQREECVFVFPKMFSDLTWLDSTLKGDERARALVLQLPFTFRYYSFGLGNGMEWMGFPFFCGFMDFAVVVILMESDLELTWVRNGRGRGMPKSSLTVFQESNAMLGVFIEWMCMWITAENKPYLLSPYFIQDKANMTWSYGYGYVFKWMQYANVNAMRWSYIDRRRMEWVETCILCGFGSRSILFQPNYIPAPAWASLCPEFHLAPSRRVYGFDNRFVRVPLLLLFIIARVPYEIIVWLLLISGAELKLVLWCNLVSIIVSNYSRIE